MLALLLLLCPVVFALLLLLAPKNTSKWIAFLASISILLVSIFSLVLFSHNEQHTLLKWHTEWLPNIGANFYLDFNGINSTLVLLTSILFLFIFLSVDESKTFFEDKKFYVLALMMQSALFGVFLSCNLFVFYIFWELALLPIFFIALLYGEAGKQKVVFKFFIYTLFGSLLMLLAIIYILANATIENLNIYNVYKIANQFSLTEQLFIFSAFFLAFAIKIPIFPLHTWQPDTYVNAPTQGTMLLSGIMLKMGTFALIFWLIPIAPLAWQKLSPYLVLLAVVSTIYGAMLALVQKSFKRLLAYSSMSHVGLIAAGIFTYNLHGLQGSVAQMFAHGINVIAIFYIYDIIFKRTNTDEIKVLSGVRSKNNFLAVFFLLILLANIGMPLTNAFVGEFLLLNSIFQYNYILSAVAGLSVILGATYMLRTYHKIMHGEPNEITENFKSLSLSEKITLIALATLVILFGLFPNLLLNLSEQDSIKLIEHVQSILK